MKARTKFAIVLLVVAVVLVTGTIAAFQTVQDRAVAQSQQRVNATASMTATEINTRLQNRQDYVAYVAGSPAAAEFGNADTYLRGFLDSSRFGAAWLVAANGTVVAAAGDPPGQGRLAGTDQGGRPTVETALAGEVYVSPVRCGQRRCVLSISAPVFEGTDVVGAFVASISLVRLGAFDALDTLRSEHRDVEVRTTVQGQRVRLAGGEHSFEDPLVASDRVAATGWIVTVERSRAELRARQQSLAAIQGVSVLLILAVVAGIGLWEYRTNLRQTERLLAGFEALQAGEYDHSLSLRAGEEWRQIAEGFDRLAAGLREREEALHEREQRLEVLNRVLRHNVRNELNLVLAHARRVTERTDDPETENAAQQIREAASRLVAIGRKARRIEDAVEQGESIERHDLRALVRGALGDLSGEYPEVTIETEFDAECEVEAIESFPYVVRNVLENAFKHNTAPEPRVSVRTERVRRDDESYVRLTVADNGPGIPSQEREVLESGSEEPLQHGSGLGLWFIYWATRESGGTMRIRDNDPTGAVVTIQVPTAD